MPESPEPNDLGVAAMIERAVDARLSRMENFFATLLGPRRRPRREVVVSAVICSLLGAAGGVAVGTWWGYGRGAEEMQQVFLNRGPEDVRAWLDLMVANPDIEKKEKQCEAGDLAHVTLSNGEHLCQIPLILHPVGMRRGGNSGD